MFQKSYDFLTRAQQ